MRNPLLDNSPPYSPPGDVLLFHDWRYLRHGYPMWRGEDGSRAELFAGAELGPQVFSYDFAATPGLRLVAQEPAKGEPVMSPANTPIDYFLAAGNVIRDGGRYRFWIEATSLSLFGRPHAGQNNYLCYAESEDGMTWRFPEQNQLAGDDPLVRCSVFGGPELGPGLHGSGVFIDPHGPAEERYKLIYLGSLQGEALARYQAKRPEALQPFALGKGYARALFAATSPDGIRWTPREEPLVVQHSDTHNACEWDEELGMYVAYVRDWFWGRRAIGRIACREFRDWPRPEPVFWPGPEVAHTTTWYANAKTRVPGIGGKGAYHVMFPLRWDAATDQFDTFMATSPDNGMWSMVPTRDGIAPVLKPSGLPGAFDAECAWMGRGMVELPGDRIGVMYSGSRVSHKHPRRPPLGAVAWATWPRDRLVALEAAADGRFATHRLNVTGRQVVANFRTAIRGEIRLQVLGPDDRVLPGYDFESCTRLTGDELARTVTWGDRDGIELPAGEQLSLQVVMRSADLFSIRFV